MLQIAQHTYHDQQDFICGWPASGGLYIKKGVRASFGIPQRYELVCIKWRVDASECLAMSIWMIGTPSKWAFIPARMSTITSHAYCHRHVKAACLVANRDMVILRFSVNSFTGQNYQWQLTFKQNRILTANTTKQAMASEQCQGVSCDHAKLRK